MLSSGSGTGARLGKTLVTAAAVLAGGAAPAAAEPALAGQWRFDEGGGQAVQDDGPLGLHGLLGSTALADGEDPVRVLGASGGALHFDGHSFVHVADAHRLDLPTLTVEARARAGGRSAPYGYLVAHGAIGCFAGSYGLYTGADGGVSFYVFDGERYYVSASARAADVWDGAWHRVTGTFDGGALRAFVDGRQVGSPFRTPAGTAVEYASLPEGTYFGSYIGSCRLPFSGELDSVRIWSDAAPPAVVAAHAGAGAATGVTHGPALAPASAGRTIETGPAPSSCAVRASRTRIRTERRSVVTVRAVGARQRLRLSVRRVGSGRIVATSKTDADGSARLVLRPRKSGRLRIGVVGRANCTPAFVTVARGH